MNFWTDERVEALKALHAKGLSCSRIAREIGGCTRNAVIGKCYRLGLTRALPSAPFRIKLGLAADPHEGRHRAPRPPRVPRAPRAAKPAPQRHHYNLAAFNLHRRKTGPKPQDVREAIAMIEVTQAKPWLEREFWECAYPVSGEGADTLSCCNPTKATYCDGHAALMFSVPQESAARLIKWGVRFAA